MIELGKKYLVRCDKSGVFYGVVTEVDNKNVAIKDSRKIYSWDGANCLEQLALEGTKKPSSCRFTVAVDIVVTDAIQFLKCTDEAIKSIDGVSTWKL